MQTQSNIIATLEGTVVRGKQLGRKLGFPTANLDLEELTGTVPPTGVYAAECVLPDGRMILSMVNIGYRPTVDNQEHQLSIEAHLIDFSADLYGQRLRLLITDRIRDERKMDSIEQLREQLVRDLKAITKN